MSFDIFNIIPLEDIADTFREKGLYIILGIIAIIIYAVYMYIKKGG